MAEKSSSEEDLKSSDSHDAADSQDDSGDRTVISSAPEVASVLELPKDNVRFKNQEASEFGMMAEHVEPSDIEVLPSSPGEDRDVEAATPVRRPPAMRMDSASAVRRRSDPGDMSPGRISRGNRSAPLTKLKRFDQSTPVSYGALRFPDTGARPSKWAAFGKFSDENDVKDLLLNTWRLPQPSVIISVTGGARELGLKKEQKEAFMEGLMTAVRTTRAWVVTGGTDGGVMKLVGETMNEMSTGLHADDMVEEDGEFHGVCLGIASWGIVDGHEEMTSGEVHRYTPLDSNWQKQREMNANLVIANEIRKKRGETSQKMRVMLDQHHTHFLFVDGGIDKEGEFGEEIDFRTKLEDCLCMRKKKKIGDEIRGEVSTRRDSSVLDESERCIMVLLVVGGGIGTLDTVLNALENDQPVVVLANSGGAASDIYKYLNMPKPDPTDPKPPKYCHARAAEMLPKIESEATRKDGVKLLTFFNENDEATAQNEGSEHAGKAWLKPSQSRDSVHAGTKPEGLEGCLMNAILSNCKAIDKLKHAATWGDPKLLQDQLSKLNDDGLITPFDLTGPLEKALHFAVKHRTPAGIECVKALCDANVQPYHSDGSAPLDLSSLFELRGSENMFAPALRLEYIAKKLNDKVLRDIISTKRTRTERSLFTLFRSGSSGLVPETELDESIRHLDDDSSAKVADELKIHLKAIKRQLTRMSTNSGRTLLTTQKESEHPHQYLLDCHPRQAFAFYALSTLGKLNDYEAHLRARAKFAYRSPNWMDLTLWATLMGHFELARLLWLKTGEYRQEPLRTAVMASRMCQELKGQISNDAAWSSPDLMRELQRGAETMEEWAVGMLDHFQNRNDAVNALTGIPARRVQKEDGGTGTEPLWPQSVISVASFETQYPCRQVIAHHNCQHVVKLYFLGIYRKSRAAVPRGTTIFQITRQCLVQIFLCFMFWLPRRYFPKSLRGPCVVYDPEPTFQLKKLFDKEDEKGLYGSTSNRRASSRSHRQLGELDEDYFEDNVEENPMEEEKRKGGESLLKEWWAFWSIPKVKYISHAFCSLIFFVLLVLLIVAPLGTYDGFQVRSGPGGPRDPGNPGDPSDPQEDALPTTGMDGTSSGPWRPTIYFGIEIAYWVFFFGMLVELVQKWLKDLHPWFRAGLPAKKRHMIGYFVGDLQVWIVLVNIVAFVCRMLILSTQLSESECFGMRNHTRLWDTDECESLGNHLDLITLIELEMLVLSLILSLFSLVRFLTYWSTVGHIWLMIREMMSESKGVVLMMGFATVGCGLALHSKLPGTQNTELEDGGIYTTDIFLPFWATLAGEIENRPQLWESQSFRSWFNWLPLLLAFYTFFTIVFLVNLMIAKMTTIYEKVSLQQVRFRSLQLLNLTLEFKDTRAAPSPVNLLLLAWSLLRLLAKLLGVCRLLDIVSSSAREQREGGLCREEQRELSGDCYGTWMGLRATQRVQEKEKASMMRYDEAARRTEAQALENRMRAMHSEVDESLSSIQQQLSHNQTSKIVGQWVSGLNTQRRKPLAPAK